jgi:hypothetical protein
MSLVIKDETAGIVVLTIDNSGQMYFGDGTPINMVTLAGIGIIDDDGHIVHGFGSANISFTSGSGTLAALNNSLGLPTSATITTLAGRQPTVQVDSAFPHFQETNVPPLGPRLNTIYSPSVVISNLASGSFKVQNTNAAAPGTGTGSVGSGAYAYRWI